MNLEFNKNEDAYKQLLSQLQTNFNKIKKGGGEKKIKAQHDKGKLTARERVDYLIDNPKDFLEVGAFAGAYSAEPVSRIRSFSSSSSTRCCTCSGTFK